MLKVAGLSYLQGTKLELNFMFASQDLPDGTAQITLVSNIEEFVL